MTYFDWNSTGIIHPKVLQYMNKIWKHYSNPSSLHYKSQQNYKLLNNYRDTIKTIFNACDYNIIFCSGATEANCCVIKTWTNYPIIVSSIEHPSIKNAPNVKILDIHHSGIINLEKLEQLCQQHSNNPFLVSIMLANNETGIIQPIEEVIAIVKKYNGYIHTDAVQACGRIKIDLQQYNVDYITISAHKFGGPVGVGALLHINDAPINQFNWGGGQENYKRSGTEAIPLIAGFVKALEVCNTSSNLYLETELEKRNCIIIGKDHPRLPNTSLVIVPHFTQSELVIILDIDKIQIGTGAACTSGKLEKSYVMNAMNINSSNIIRISSGYSTKKSDFNKLLRVLDKKFIQ